MSTNGAITYQPRPKAWVNAVFFIGLKSRNVCSWNNLVLPEISYRHGVGIRQNENGT